jgi:homoserine kinase
MSSGEKVTYEIKVPATAANLGPGFDSLALAMRVYNKVTVTVGGRQSVMIEGEGADELPTDDSNLMLRTAREFARRAGGRELPPLQWRAHNCIPPARGMGSSSAAIVTGLLATNAIFDLGWRKDGLVRLAAEIEGHPDNVAAALMGGLTICMPGSEPLSLVRVKPDARWGIALLMPSYQLSTERMREVLPDYVPYADAVFNLGRSAAMVAVLEHPTMMDDIPREACRDRLHQPYRGPMIRGMDAIFEAAYGAGARAVAVSGSGPTVVAFVGWGRQGGGGEGAARAMLEAARSEGVEAESMVTGPDLHGAKVTRRD